METFHKNKKIFITIGVLVAVVLIYEMFFTGGSTDPTARSVDPTAGGLVSDLSVSSSDAILGHELLALLAHLQSITLDTSIFTDKAFLALVDKTRPIEDQPSGKKLGRRNPFSNFAEGGVVTEDTSVQIR